MPSSGVQTCADRKSTRLNSSHLVISYAVFCLKKKKVDGGTDGEIAPAAFDLTFCTGITSPVLAGVVSKVKVASFIFDGIFFFLMVGPPPISTLFPYTTLFKSMFDEAIARGPVSVGIENQPLFFIPYAFRVDDDATCGDLPDKVAAQAQIGR